MKHLAKAGIILAVACLCACRKAAPGDATPQEAAPPTNRIAVPESVRRNLGIEFVEVERRRIAATLRVPGHFELLPAARREYRTPVDGRVEIAVQPLQPVKLGDVLYRIDSPEWRRMQRELADLATTVTVARARIDAMKPLLAAHVVHEQSLQEAARVTEAWIQKLEETRANVGGQAPELAAAQVQLAQARADLAEAVEKRAETASMLAELEANHAAGRDRFTLALHAASAVVAMDREKLHAELPDARQPGDGSKVPAWRLLDAIEIRAVADGIVEALPVATGGWVEVGDLVLATVDLQQVRFRARALQSDLPRLRAGLPAQAVPPQRGGDLGRTVAGELALGVAADPLQQTIDLFLVPATTAAADWARPGVAGFLEVETASGAEAELAVPLSAVLPDGLQRVLFRRDPADPDTVIRLEADLGLDDGRWIEVKSGIRDGDEVVLAGAYELMLASSGAASKGGHFHADGTFHEGPDKK